MRLRSIAAFVALAATAGVVTVAPAAEPGPAGGAGETARSAAGPTLTVRPRAARRGGRVVFYGEGFRPLVRVVLLAGPPASEAVKIGNAKTDEDGEFVAPIAIERRVRAGRYVALACRESCRVKASAIFRVLP